MHTGIFMEGSVSGVYYETPHFKDELDAGGHYKYEDGDTITFSIGGLILGTCDAQPVVTTLDLFPESCGAFMRPAHPAASNMARLLLSIGQIRLEQDLIIAKHKNEICFSCTEAEFEEKISACMDELGKDLISPERTRNILRRCGKNILKENIKIPTRDGRLLTAVLFRPLTEGKYPVVMSMGAFGTSFVTGFTRTEEDESYFEKLEDAYYERYGDPETSEMLLGAFFKRMSTKKDFEIPNMSEESAPEGSLPVNIIPVTPFFEQSDPDQWVPHGYAVIHVEEYGNGVEGVHEYQFGARNALDYCDAIEWAASQVWSSGKVGLYGASYYAMTQYLAAQHHPEGLCAMIAIMGDYDSYRHYVRSGGGLLNIFDNADLSEPRQEYGLNEYSTEHKFIEDGFYGTDAEYLSSADISKIDYPLWTVAEPDASLHGLGSSEAFINSPSKHKKFSFVNGAAIHFWMFNEKYLLRHRAFFDHWLKCVENGIMDEPPVELHIRTGNGSYYKRFENEWPIADTEYRKLYLDLSSDGLSESMPFMDGEVSYPADVKRSQTKRVTGASFISEKFKKDTAIAGYIKAGLYVSSTTHDMEIHIELRVLDETGAEVIYPAHTSMERALPLGFGSILVSHRAIDEKTSRPEYPVHPHTRETYAPLTPNEPVYCEIALFPTTGLIKKGRRLKLDITPVSNRWVEYDEMSYRKDSYNTVYCGPAMPSFIQIPVVEET